MIAPRACFDHIDKVNKEDDTANSVDDLSNMVPYHQGWHLARFFWCKGVSQKREREISEF